MNATARLKFVTTTNTLSPSIPIAYVVRWVLESLALLPTLSKKDSPPSADVIRGSGSRILSTPSKIHHGLPYSRLKLHTTRILDFVQRLYMHNRTQW